MNIFERPASILEIGAPWLDYPNVAEEPETCECCGWKIKGDVVVRNRKPYCVQCSEDMNIEEEEAQVSTLERVAGAIG